jgi:hypothetical protein
MGRFNLKGSAMKADDDLSPTALRALGHNLLEQIKWIHRGMIALFATDLVFICVLIFLAYHLSAGTR